MKPHYISHFNVKNLWGDKTIDFPLFQDVNVIIGPNASGKTTIINLLMFALTGNIVRLVDYKFDIIKIVLKPFDNGPEVVVTVSQDSEVIRYEIDGKVVTITLFPGLVRARQGGFANVPPELSRRHYSVETSHLRHQLEGLVPAAWLPVSRRLPMADDEEEDRRRMRRSSLESVDECLSELLEGLQRYRLSLDAKLSELRMEFQKRALENILYDKRHDRMIDLQGFQHPTETDKEQLIKAFQDVGFVDSGMEKRVEEHFDAAHEAIDKIKRDPNSFTDETLFIIPLIHRTKQMVDFAQELEAKRTKLFAALSQYESMIRSFIKGKDVSVTPRGELEVKKPGDGQKEIEWRNLSSGEKQLLILLTQALLWEKDPVVYVADEPELSLHVLWQERLLKSVTALAGSCQVIVATHSPDIAGGFPQNVIDLARL